MAQLADCMTKDSDLGRGILLKFLLGGRWRLTYDPRFLSARKRAREGLDILATPATEDIDDKTMGSDKRDQHVEKVIKMAKHEAWKSTSA